jgi:hypothetical protein
LKILYLYDTLLIEIKFIAPWRFFVGKKRNHVEDDTTENCFDDDFDEFHIDYEDEKRGLNTQRRRARSERRRTRFTYSQVEFDTD